MTIYDLSNYCYPNYILYTGLDNKMDIEQEENKIDEIYQIEEPDN